MVLSLAVFFVSFAFYQTIHTLPVPSGSGAIPEVGIDCSQPPSSKTDLSEIESGLFVIEKYIHLQISKVIYFSPVTLNNIIVIALHTITNIDIFFYFQILPHVCYGKSPVAYTKSSTEHLPTSSVNSPKYLANWYAVITAFNQHLSDMESTITDQTEMTRLTTTVTLLTGLQQSYLTVLQDFLCNCSESCQIPTIQPEVSYSCNKPASNTLFILYMQVIKLSRSTLNAYNQNCNCQSPTKSTTALEWFLDVFPSDDPHYKDLQKMVTP